MTVLAPMALSAAILLPLTHQGFEISSSQKIHTPQLISQVPASCGDISRMAQYVTKGGYIYIDPATKNVWDSSNCKHIGTLNSYMYLDGNISPCDPQKSHPATLAGSIASVGMNPPKCVQVYYKLEDRVVDGISVQLVQMVARDAREVVRAQWYKQQEPNWKTQLVGISKNACQRYNCDQLVR